MCKINLNQELNGIELSFASKPDRATLDSIKAQGFRWNGRKCVWYAKQTPDRLTFAKSLGELDETTPKASKPATINLDNLGENTPHLYGAELAAAIREDLKKRGAKGCTVRTSRGYGLTVTVKASAEDFASIEEYAERYSFGEFSADVQMRGLYIGGGFNGWLYANEFEKMTEEEQERAYYNFISDKIAHRRDYNIYHRERKNYPQFTTAFCEKLNAVFEIANQWNYDHSDSMTDYFDVGYYLDINIKAGEIEPRATMTEEERTAYEEEQRQEEEERARQAAEWERQREEQRKREEERRKADEIAEELIYNSIMIEDLDENEQLYITDCVGGIGKEVDYTELVKSIREEYKEDCLIDRKVIFTNEQAYNEYIQRFMYDYIFLYGKGGTGSNDVRLEAVEHIYNLNTEQRESVKWFCCHCVGIYLDDCLKLIVNPEGHNYSRYVYLPTETSEELNAAEVSRDQENESKTREPFYFPASVEEQAAILHEGMEITIYQCNGWLLNSINAGKGIVTGFYTGTWAQYDGLYITLLNGRKENTVFIRNDNPCLIYEGIKDKLPDSITRRQISENMYEMFNYDVLLPNTYSYYKSLGEYPIIDTFQR